MDDARRITCLCGVPVRPRRCCERRTPLPFLDPEPARLRAFDEALVARVLEWLEREGVRPFAVVPPLLSADDSLRTFVEQTLAYGLMLPGGELSAVDAFIAANRATLAARERDWLALQRDSRLGLWLVCRGFDDEKPAALDDLLTLGVEPAVSRETTRSLPSSYAVLGRVVPHRDGAILIGAHPRAAPMLAAWDVARMVFEDLGLDVPGEQSVPLGGVRQLRFALDLGVLWTTVVRALDSAPPPRPVDPDRAHFVFDLYTIAPGAAEEIARRARALDAAARVERTEDGETVLEFFDDVVAEGITHRVRTCDVHVSADEVFLSLRARTAEQFRRRVESACEGLLVEHLGRELFDPNAVNRPGAARSRAVF